MPSLTDKELLELAAKAAGVEFHKNNEDWNHEDHCAVWHYADLCTCGAKWNPLIDDGDALRLAVRLGVSIDPSNDAVCVISPSGHAVIERGFGDELVPAARRAIVRAAAEIGRAMP